MIQSGAQQGLLHKDCRPIPTLRPAESGNEGVTLNDREFYESFPSTFPADGRPEGETKTLSFEVCGRMYDRIEKVAAEKGMTPGAYVRGLVERTVKALPVWSMIIEFDEEKAAANDYLVDDLYDYIDRSIAGIGMQRTGKGVWTAREDLDDRISNACVALLELKKRDWVTENAAAWRFFEDGDGAYGHDVLAPLH